LVKWAAGTSLATIRTDNAPKVHFFATLGEKPVIEVSLI